jgi:KaiC/GvpD/RAD55 family RecA-like ATPase
VSADVPPYELHPVAPDERSLEVPAGTSLLVTAAPAAGREFVLGSLRAGLDRGEAGLVVTTDEPAGDVVADIGRAEGDGGGLPTDHLRVVDCQAGDTGIAEEGREVAEVRYVETPRNLTDIGIGFKDAFDGFEAAGRTRVRFGLLSLSVVLSYVDLETTYRFCQTLARGLAREDAVGLFHLAPGAHDDRTVKTLRRAFDGTVETAQDDGNRTVRVSGVEGVRETWADL